jgi:uncharacterized protein (DUF433 family)
MGAIFMSTMIQISPETYKLLQRRAQETQSTPEQIAEAAIRLQLGNTIHIEQKQAPTGPQAYLRGTRVAVRHVAAFLKAGYTAEEIMKTGLPHVLPAAIYEAIAYYYDHQTEIDTELKANSQEAVLPLLRDKLSAEQFARLTGQAA